MAIFVRRYLVHSVSYKHVGFGWCDLVNANTDRRDKETWRRKENSRAQAVFNYGPSNRKRLTIIILSSFQTCLVGNTELNNQSSVKSTISHTFCVRRQTDATRF